MNHEPLLILPFDHRSSFSKNLFGWDGKLNAKQNKQISLYKTIVYKGFLEAAKSEANKKHFGILVDQDFGTPILRDAKKKGFTVTMPVEKSGQEALTFNYGNSFGAWIEKIKPDYAKILVRYHPDDKEINKIQLSRISKFNAYCKKHGHKMMFELLVPASEKDLKKMKTESAYDAKLRPIHTVKAIKEITKVIQPELWKMEGFSKSDWKKVLQAIGKDADVIILGRGQDDKKVENWLKDAASFNQIVGFAVGRTIFFEPLEQLKDKKITQQQAIQAIGKNYSKYISLWQKAKKSV
jgi:myo-inositol catabolism protein IolC